MTTCLNPSNFLQCPFVFGFILHRAFFFYLSKILFKVSFDLKAILFTAKKKGLAYHDRMAVHVGLTLSHVFVKSNFRKRYLKGELFALSSKAN